MDDHQFRRLLEHLELSWPGYKKVRKGVKKRISRHMMELNCSDISGYLLELGRNVEARNECEQLMTVSISRFFRDKKLWEFLEGEIFPDLIKSEKDIISIWCAGCASGEEAYSLMILWEILKDQFDHIPRLQLLATDMNPLYLEKAKQGSYPKSSLKEASQEIQDRYFHSLKGGRRFEINPSLKGNISWLKHHLLEDPPEQEFQLIFLRNNLLTYYDEQIKVPAFRNIVESLAVGGFLIIGTHEKLLSGGSGLEPLGKWACIFVKNVT